MDARALLWERTPMRPLLLCLPFLLLAACGQSGNLYLPETKKSEPAAAGATQDKSKPADEEAPKSANPPSSSPAQP